VLRARDVAAGMLRIARQHPDCTPEEIITTAVCQDVLTAADAERAATAALALARAVHHEARNT
jgi:hypothetical protein